MRQIDSLATVDIADIPDDHLAEVLKRLTPKEFAQAQTVCKRFRDVSLDRAYPQQHAEMLRQMTAWASNVPALAKTLQKPNALTYSKSTPFLEVHGKSKMPRPIDTSGLPHDWHPRLVGPRYVTPIPSALQQVDGIFDTLGLTMLSLRNLACNCVAVALKPHETLEALYLQAGQAHPSTDTSQGTDHAARDAWRRRAKRGIQAIYNAPKLDALPYTLRDLITVIEMLAKRHEALDPAETMAERRALRVGLLQAMSETPGDVIPAQIAIQGPIACALIEILRGYRVIRGMATLEPAVFRPEERG